MRKQLTTEAELKDLVGTQYVFTEVRPVGDDFALFKKTYKVEIDVKSLPRNFIISSKGELIKDFNMTDAGTLAGILKEGIEKTGGLKGAAGAAARLKAALQAVTAAQEKWAESEGSLEPLLELIALDRTQGKQIPEVRKQIKAILNKVDKDPVQKPLLSQARMLDAASQFAADKKAKRASDLYKDVIAKFPDSPGAKVAEERLAELATPAEGGAEDGTKKKASDKPAAATNAS